MRDEVSTGQRLQRAMENTGLFPNMVNQMIAVGEESGSLDEMSSKVASFYEAEVDNAVDAMSSLLEPLRSEEHTSELQSRLHLVCRLLLEKKKKQVEHETRDRSSYTYT